MELLNLIKKESDGNKTFYKVIADLDEKKNEITLNIEKGVIGKRKTIKITHKINSSEIRLSSKKGVTSLAKFAKEMGDKILLTKKKEGFTHNLGNIGNYNKNKDLSNEDNTLESNIILNNKYLTYKDISDTVREDSFNNICPSEHIRAINSDNDEFSIKHLIKYVSPNKMICPKDPIKHQFYEPMLAHPYEKRKKDIVFPCFVQPKLDGVRALAVNTDLYSRNGNKFPTLSHIKDELAQNTEKLLLDGELYTDDINFEKIVGLVKKGRKTKEEEEKSLKIYLNVFDYIEPGLTFEERISNLYYFFKQHKFKHIKLVKTERCFNPKEVEIFLDKYTKEGYEGVIMRNVEGKYFPNGRSVNLQKLKKFFDEEFEIVDFTSSEKGAEKGCVIWKCKAKSGRTFNVKPLGSIEERRKIFQNGKNYIGKKLTVKYQEITNHGVPRFPIGIGIRDYE